MLRWPEEEARRARISQAGAPRLLLVPDGEEPPAVADCLEDWIRVPADENEVQARVDALAVRSQAHAPNSTNSHSPAPTGPELDDFGVFDSQWAAHAAALALKAVAAVPARVDPRARRRPGISRRRRSQPLVVVDRRNSRGSSSTGQTLPAARRPLEAAQLVLGFTGAA